MNTGTRVWRLALAWIGIGAALTAVIGATAKSLPPQLRSRLFESGSTCSCGPL